MKHSSQEMESSNFTISICVQMKIHMRFSHHTNSGSASTSGQVFVGLIYLDLTYFQTYRAGLKACLENDTPGFLADVTLFVHRELRFLQDDAPAHFSLDALRYLNRKFSGRWRGKGEPLPGLHSPYLIPLDFYLWGRLNPIVWSSPVDDMKTLQNRIMTDFHTKGICQEFGIFFGWR
jgi:hypothetical protein